jgi:glycosyltransferase involved in cell wall biosynthesis
MSSLVVFDAYELVPGAGKSIGIYNYAKNLWRALQVEPAQGAGIRWCVTCNVANANDFPVIGDPAMFSRQIVGASVPGKIARQLWLRGGSVWVLRRLGASAYFSPKGFLPAGLKFALRGGPAVVTVHDLIPFWYQDKLPGYFGIVEERLVNGGLLRAVRRADTVIAISHATAADIKLRTGRDAGVSVVYNGVPFSPAAAARPRAGKYLFAVSSHLPHKNLNGLLGAYRAYRALESDPLPLVVCGVRQPDEPGVEAVRNISDVELHSYYAHAEVVLFLSHIEGFGFPPVEAMLHGARVLCSDIPSLREVTLGQATYVDQTDGAVAGLALSEMLKDAGEPGEETAEARRQAARTFSWAQCASGVRRQIEQCLQ